MLRRLRRNGYRVFQCGATGALLLLLSACQSQQEARLLAEAETKLPRQVTGASDRMILSMEKRLTNKGVRVLSMGDNYLVSIPAKVLFAEQSPQLTWVSYDVLNDVACYLRQLRTVDVHVSAFTSRYASVKREKALSLARAGAVSNYLWSQGVDARFMFSHGQGGDKPMVSKITSGDKSPNARIEITFRRALI